MGGLPSLGYDVNDRRLVVNEAESETVRSDISSVAIPNSSQFAC
jgi:hypothetical protein